MMRFALHPQPFALSHLCLCMTFCSKTFPSIQSRGCSDLLSPIIFAPPTNDIPTCFIYFPGPCRPMPLGFASAQLSECLQRCLTPQSVPPGLALPAAPPGLPAPLALPAAALGPQTPLLPPMPEVDMGVESSPETAEMPARLGAEWFASVSDASDGSLRFEPFFWGG